MSAVATEILYVITDLKLGGVPLHLHRLARSMGGRGYLPRVVSLAGPGPVAGMLADDGVEVLSCNGRGGWDLRVIGELTRIIRDKPPDIIHAFLFHANLAARWAAGSAGFPKERVVCEIQTVEVERKWHLWVDRFTHGRCRFTIGNSPSVIEHLVVNAGIPRDRLRLVRGGIDPGRFRQAVAIDRSALGLDSDAGIILWVGRLDPVKGLPILVDAFRAIVGETRAHLLLAGTGPLQDQLAEQIRRSSLTGRVHLLGPRDDVPALLKAADVFVLPSRTEGLPNALLEAMAAGCAVVTTDVPGCRDLIEHQETGLVVPYGDTPALADAIRRLLTDRPLASGLSRRAAEVVEKSWHIDRTFDAYEALYREMSTAM